MTQGHIVQSFEYELCALGDAIMRMGGLVEAQIESAVQAIVRRDADMATRVIETDKRIDDLEDSINEEVLRLLALRQPMAVDLRAIVSALRISSDLERIGDYAANIAKRVIVLVQAHDLHSVHVIVRMSRLVQEIVKDVLDGYVTKDPDRTLAAWRRDEEVDALYTSLFRELLTYMMEDPRNITPCAHLLFIAKNIERIGDHATNIAETNYFLITGDRLQGARPKGDTSSYAIVTPDRFGAGDNGSTP